MVVCQVVHVRNRSQRNFRIVTDDPFYSSPTLDGGATDEDSFEIPPHLDAEAEGLVVPWSSTTFHGLIILEVDSGQLIRCTVGPKETDAGRDWLRLHDSDWAPIAEDEWLELGPRHWFGAIGKSVQLQLTFQEPLISGPGHSPEELSSADALAACVSFMSEVDSASPSTVFLNVYDLAPVTSAVNSLLCNTVVKTFGAFHAAIEVYGAEWGFYRQQDPDLCGVCRSRQPRHHPVHVYRQSVNLGQTQLTERRLGDIIAVTLRRTVLKGHQSPSSEMPVAEGAEEGAEEEHEEGLLTGHGGEEAIAPEAPEFIHSVPEEAPGYEAGDVETLSELSEAPTENVSRCAGEAPSQSRSRWKPDMALFYPLLRLKQRQSRCEATFNLLNNLMGAGLLTMPRAMADAGLISGLALMGILALANRYTMLQVLWMSHSVLSSEECSYPELGRHVFGQKGLAAVLAAYLLLTLGILSSYLMVIVDLLNLAIPGYRLLHVLLAALLCLPGAMLRSLKQVALVSVICMLGVCSLVVVLTSVSVSDVLSEKLMWTCSVATLDDSSQVPPSFRSSSPCKLVGSRS
eukprot:s1121_g3.t1